MCCWRESWKMYYQTYPLPSLCWPPRCWTRPLSTKSLVRNRTVVDTVVVRTDDCSARGFSDLLHILQSSLYQNCKQLTLSSTKSHILTSGRQKRTLKKSSELKIWAVTFVRKTKAMTVWVKTGGKQRCKQNGFYFCVLSTWTPPLGLRTFWTR